jgi:carboxypeptidase Q
MNKQRGLVFASVLVLLVGLPLLAGNETINYEDLNKIKAEGVQRSQVMELNSWLSDVYAPRLSGSPGYDRGAEWAMKKMKEWGLVNIKTEEFALPNNKFERGWTNDKFYMSVVEPERFAVPGTPTAWTPGTNGLVRGEVALVTATNEEELAQYKGKLQGKWVLMVAAPDVAAFWNAPSKRYSVDELASMELNPPAPATEFGITPPGGARQGAPPAQQGPARQAAPGTPQAQAQGPRGTPAPAGAPQQPGGRGAFAGRRNDFLRAEGALGTISTIPRGHGLYTIGGSRTADPATTLPAISIAAEQYGRIARMAARNVPVTIEAEIKNTFYPNPKVYNIVGEIPGTDKADEVVVIGAHFDTWHAATGAADDGVGTAAMMEAMRILKATGVKLRRTVRIGLWAAEEQGLLGSREYVSAHYGSRQQPPGGGERGGGPGGFGGPQGPLELKPDHAKLSVYFNIDNGTGALRGIYTQGNEAVVPIFREWMEPFRSMGMNTVTVRNTGGTDHLSFDGVGLPGFQFIQDDIEYDTVTHHTNMDTYERLQPRDCIQMSTIVAGFAYLAANREEKMPRKPLSSLNQGRGRGAQP